MNRPIALLTDFGLTDHYVGSLKSVILSINPKAVIFDLTHEIRPQNVREGAYILSTIYPYLPQGTIVVSVIDPGVGSEREALCIETERGYLMGPDNGLMSVAVSHQKFRARKLTNDKFFLKPVSSTFHGRDIFSSTAAHLSKRNIFESLGPMVDHFNILELPHPTANDRVVTGEIVHIDRFGNAMTNISFKEVKWNNFSIQVSGQTISLKPFFGAGKEKELFAIWNGSQILELAVFKGSAEKIHRLKLGDAVEVVSAS